MPDYKPVGPFNYEKFIDTYSTIPDYRSFVAWFSSPDENGVWAPTTAGPITLEGVISLLFQDAVGNIADIQIRHW